MTAETVRQDMHMHFMLSGKPVDLQGVREILLAYQSHCISTVYDMGHHTGIGLQAKAIAEDLGINLKTSIMAITNEHGYGGFLGMKISNTADCIKAVKMLANKGADFIKVVNSGLVDISEYGKVTAGGFDVKTLRAIVLEAKSHALQVACHANSPKAIADAIEAGVDVIEHGYYISTELIDMMAKNRVSWTPTVFALYSQLTELPANQQGSLRRILKEHLQMIDYALSIGVQVNIGTDSGLRGVNHAQSYFKEFDLIFNKQASLL